MFQDLDETLKSVLNDASAPDAVKNAEKSFLAPAHDFSPNSPTLNLFLYQITENHELRDPTATISRLNDTSFVRERPPWRIDCSYMVTAWSNESGDDQVAAEHALLGTALRWLTRFPVIPANHLKGSLVNPPFAPPALLAQLEDGKSLGEFWSALGTPPRPSFNLVVTIAMDVGAQRPEGPPVTTHRMNQHLCQAPVSEESVITATSESRFRIGGRVFDSAAPQNEISGAKILLIETNQEATSDHRGNFMFALLESGTYTLRVSHDGFPAQPEKPIAVPGTTVNAYDIGLVP